jgi:hypothetical protein
MWRFSTLRAATVLASLPGPAQRRCGMQRQLFEQLSQGFVEIGEFAPRLAMAVGVLLVGVVIAKMFERGTSFVLRKIGFDRWMREGGVTEALERAGTTLDPSAVLGKLIFWAIMLLVIILGANALGVSAVSVLFSELVNYIPNVIAATIVLVLGNLLGEFLKDLVLASTGGVAGAPTLARAAKAAVLLLATFMALEQLDIAQDIVLVFFIAVVGAAALAAGIAFGYGGRDVARDVIRDWYARNRAHAASRPAGPESTSAADAASVEPETSDSPHLSSR